MRDLEVLLVVMKQLSRLCNDVPRLGGWPIEGAIDDLTCNRATYTASSTGEERIPYRSKAHTPRPSCDIQ